MRIVHDDDDIVVVDKPVGVAAHPSPGWTGPTVVGGLAGAGYRISTSGAAERQGVVHRLDVGTTGPDGGRQERARLHAAEAAVQGAHRRQGLPRGRAGPPGPVARHHRRADRPAPHSTTTRWAVVTGGKPSVTHYDTLEAFRHASLLEVQLETGRTHQIRVHFSALRHPCVGDLTYGADPVLADRLGLYRQWLHAVRLGFAHPGTGERVEFTTPYPADLQHALDVISA